MAKVEPLGKEMDLVKKSFADVFAGKALAWQLGGTMVAALLYSAMMSVRVSGGVGRFLLASLAFLLAYVVLTATGCLVARLLHQGVDDAEGGVAPLHFLIDNIGTALLLPAVTALVAVLAVVLGVLYSLLWGNGVMQAIFVWLAPIFFVAALLLVCDLFVLLFLTPAMVVSDQPSFMDGVKRLVRLYWVRKWQIAKMFGIGLVVSVAVVLPVALAVYVAKDLCGGVYQLASGEYFRDTARFALNVFFYLLVIAPILTIPLAFMTALSLNAYGELAEGLDADADDEEGEAPAAGEEPDVIVEGEGADADETKAE